MLPILLSFIISVSNQTTPFKSGKDLQESLAANVKWSSIGVELASLLHDFQSQSEVSILRDRRLDPHRLIGVETDFVPRVQVLKRLSDAIPETSICITSDFAFLGPALAADRLPILLNRNTEQINRLRKKIDQSQMRRLSARIEASWDELAEPRIMLVDAGKSVGVVILNPAMIPHDVWAACRLPKMSFVELATIVLNQFDLTFTVANNGIELTVLPIDPLESFEHKYPLGKLKPAVAEVWKNQMPDLEIKWSGSNAIVTTSLQNHSQLSTALQNATYKIADVSTSAGSENSLRTTYYQLKVERATLRQLIEHFRSKTIAIEVVDENSPEVQEIMKQTITLSEITDRLPGTKLFPLIFGKHFKRVDVEDDRVVLSAD